MKLDLACLISPSIDAKFVPNIKLLGIGNMDNAIVFCEIFSPIREAKPLTVTASWYQNGFKNISGLKQEYWLGNPSCLAATKILLDSSRLSVLWSSYNRKVNRLQILCQDGNTDISGTTGNGRAWLIMSIWYFAKWRTKIYLSYFEY